MDCESTPEENQIVSYETQVGIPPQSNALARREDIGGQAPSGALAPFEGSNVYKRISIKGSKNVHFGSVHHHHQQNITQIINPSGSQNASSTLNESPVTKDEFLQNVPYLQELYSTENAYMSSLLWDDDERDYSLKDYFINLKLDDDRLGVIKKRQDIPLESIFLPDAGERSPSRILITGSPGYGKSTICSKLAYDWSMLEPPHYLSQFDVLVVVPLNQLRQKTIEEAIVDILADEQTDIEKFKTSLCKSKHKFLILLDGLDEAVDASNVDRSLKPHKSPVRFPNDTTILLTSRSHAAKSVRKLFHRHLCVNGFTVNKQKEYIERFFLASELAQTSMSDILLSEESVINEFAECPLMLHMMCCLHEESDLSSLKRATDIYLQVFDHFFTRYESKYSYHPLFEGQFMKGQYYLLKLGKMSFDVLSGKLPEISEKVLTVAFSKQDEYDIVLKLGLLKTSRIYSRGRIVIVYEILHRVFLEFLAAFYFYHDLQTSQTVNHDMLREVLEHRFCENFLICLAGLLKDNFHRIISGDEDDRYYEWQYNVVTRLLKECGHTKNNMEACKQWLQHIFIDTTSYEHRDVDVALPLALKCQNSITECISFKFGILDEYNLGRYFVITPKLLRSMKDCCSLKSIEVYIHYEVFQKDGDGERIAFVDMTAIFAFLNKLLQMVKAVNFSIALHSDMDFDPFIEGKFIEESESYLPVVLESVSEGHELLGEENFIIRMNHIGGATVKFMIFPHVELPRKITLGIPRPDYEDFTETDMFKQIVEFLQSRNMTIEIYLSELEDLFSFDTKAYPLNA